MLVVGIVIVVILAMILLQLRALVSAGSVNTPKISQFGKSEIIQTGQRGTIYDRNGVPLAYDETSYNVQFSRDYNKATAQDRAHYTQILMKTIELIERNGGETIDTFVIRRNDDLEYSFEFGITDEEAIKKREENWRANMYISDRHETPEQIYNYLRQLYQIPNSIGYEDAIKLLSIWQEVQLNAYRASIPIVIASNVGINVVTEIEERSLELEGMNIQESSARIYPKHELAAHTIGYLGVQSSPELLEELVKQGYDPGDLVGMSGIEKTLEDALTSNTSERRGKIVNEVDTKGTVIRELETVEPQNGNNVVLTLDAELQKLVEDALMKNIEDIRTEQMQMIEENKEEYLKKVSDLSKIRLAEYGAAVVMDVNTGDVLAKVSVPSYDLNLFSGGISVDDYDALKEDTALPLFDKTISSKAMPGSIFKMVTAVAGLMEGEITVDTIIEDEGAYTKYLRESQNVQNAPQCWIYNMHRITHGEENLESAIKDSCNYYFYEVADRVKIDRLAYWGEQLGLSTKTNIEVPGEIAGQIGGQDILYDNSKPLREQNTSLPLLVMGSLKTFLKGCCEDRGIEVTDEQLEKAATRIVELVGVGNIQGRDIRVIMREELGIPETISYYRRWHADVMSYLNEITWNADLTLRTGMGQSVVSVTPMAVARYVSALVNGGVVYDAHIVDKVLDHEGNLVQEITPTIHSQIDLQPRHIQAIKEGMKGVVDEGGTAGSVFRDYKYVDDIGGKTGTAQVSTSSRNISVENTSWFVAFAPFDEPEIAIVIYVPFGIGGSSTSYTAQQIISYYLDNKYQHEENVRAGNMQIPAENTAIMPNASQPLEPQASQEPENGDEQANAPDTDTANGEPQDTVLPGDDPGSTDT
jgi:penicillin-binding protein 2